MEKLLELLNDFIERKYKDHLHRTKTNINTWKEIIVSKNFGFITDLVERWNINEWKFFDMTEDMIQDGWRKIDPPEFETTVKDLETYNKIRKKYLSERLIMFLSIQDDPIKVLIEIIE